MTHWTHTTSAEAAYRASFTHGGHMISYGSLANSGARFYYTNDKRYIVKTIPQFQMKYDGFRSSWNMLLDVPLLLAYTDSCKQCFRNTPNTLQTTPTLFWYAFKASTGSNGGVKRAMGSTAKNMSNISWS